MKENVIRDKSFEFALKIIEIYKYLTVEVKEYILAKQLIRSGTSIGANVREAIVSQSKKEFIAKMNIALKEAHETEYWLALLYQSSYISKDISLQLEISELIRLLTAIIKSSNENRG